MCTILKIRIIEIITNVLFMHVWLLNGTVLQNVLLVSGLHSNHFLNALQIFGKFSVHVDSAKYVLVSGVLNSHGLTLCRVSVLWDSGQWSFEFWVVLLCGGFKFLAVLASGVLNSGWSYAVEGLNSSRFWPVEF